MLRLNRHFWLALITIGLSSWGSVTWALKFEPGIGAGFAYTDNADLVDKNEEDDVVAVGYVGASVKEDSGSIRADATSSYTYQKYLDNTVGDRNYFNLRSNAEWEQARGRLYWNVSDYFSQRKIDSLDASRDNNVQNTNVFTLGPSIRFQSSGPHSFSITPQYRNFYYRTTDNDNQQYEMAANWNYQMRPTLQVGLNGRVYKVDYDNEDRNPNTLNTTVQAVFSGSGPRSRYTLNVGGTQVNRDEFDDTSGFTGSLTWLRELSGRSNVRLFLETSLRNTSNNLLNLQQNPDDGALDNQQNNGDVIRNNNMTLVYKRTGAALNTSINGQIQDLDYEETPNDRRIYRIETRMDYKLAPLVETSLRVTYRYLDQKEDDRIDKEYRVSGKVSYKLSRDLRTELAIRYRDKTSDVATQEYTETAVFVGLVWGFGSIPRIGTSSF